MEGTELSRNSREPSRTNWNERSNRRPKREEGGNRRVEDLRRGLRLTLGESGLSRVSAIKYA